MHARIYTVHVSIPRKYFFFREIPLSIPASFRKNGFWLWDHCDFGVNDVKLTALMFWGLIDSCPESMLGWNDQTFGRVKWILMNFFPFVLLNVMWHDGSLISYICSGNGLIRSKHWRHESCIMHFGKYCIDRLIPMMWHQRWVDLIEINLKMISLDWC